MCCLICCVCMKKEFDISCSIYQGQGEIRHRRWENQMEKMLSQKETGCQRICNERYGTCCNRNRRCEKELIPTLASLKN